jgi:O-antigen ligase
VPGTATSTFGDFHELAGYLGIIILVAVALNGRAQGPRTRWAFLIAIAASVTALYFTAVRSEYLALAVALVMVATWRPARFPALIGVTALALLFVSPLITYAVSSVLTGQPPNAGTPTTNVTTRYTDSTFWYSWNERFNVKWPGFWAKAMSSPIVGLGPSAATEAADGYYMRSFVEAGIVGLASFLALLGAITLSLWRAARAAVGTARSLAVAMLMATLFLAAVGVLIDTWVASRVMELYWPLLGTSLALASLALAPRMGGAAKQLQT